MDREKDLFWKRTTRKEIAKGIIDKMEKFDAKDIELIPALNDYVMNGNIDYFQEYMDFHFIKSTEEKAKKLIDTKELEEAINSSMKEAGELVKKYNSYVDEYRAYCRKLYKEAVPDNFLSGPTLGDLYSFISELFASKKQQEQRKLYIIVDNKAIAVEKILITDNKVVLIPRYDMAGYNIWPKEPPHITKIQIDGSVDTWD